MWVSLYVRGVIINIFKGQDFPGIVEHSARTAQWTLSVSLIETDQLMLHKEMIAVYSFYAVKPSCVKKGRNSNS